MNVQRDLYFKPKNGDRPRAHSFPRLSRRSPCGARPATRRLVSWLMSPSVAYSAGAEVTNATIPIAGQSGMVRAVVITAARLQPVRVGDVLIGHSLTAGQTA